MKFRGWQPLAAAMVDVIALASTPAAAQRMKFFRIASGAAGGTYFPMAGMIANAVSNPPGSRPCDKGGSCGVSRPGSGGAVLQRLRGKRQRYSERGH